MRFLVNGISVNLPRSNKLLDLLQALQIKHCIGSNQKVRLEFEQNLKTSDNHMNAILSGFRLQSAVHSYYICVLI